MECVRLPPEIIRAIEKTISAGGAAKVRLIRGVIFAQHYLSAPFFTASAISLMTS